MNLKRTWAISNKEFIQIKRDPRSLALALVIPVFLLIIFGYGLSLDIDRVRTVVWNQDTSSQLTRDFLLNFKNSKYFRIISYTDNYRDIERMINNGQAMMALIIPKDFSHYLQSAKAAPLQLLVDGSDSNTATIAMGYVRSVVATYNLNLLVKTFAKYGIKPERSVDLRSRIWFNMGLTSRWFITPGVIAMIIMIIAALLTSICVAREWERGTMEQLISTPVKPLELIVGKLLPYFTIGFFDLSVGVIMIRFLFGVPFRGNYLLLVVLSALFLIGALSQGIFISITARTQLLASQLATLTTFIPTMLLSGFIYPIFNMPPIIRSITYFVPARYFIFILRGLFLKGSGMRVLWYESLFLFLFAFLMFNLAVRKFKKKVALMMFERVRAILIKEFKQVLRDPRMKTVIFISPLIQILLFGYAANKDIDYIPRQFTTRIIPRKAASFCAILLTPNISSPNIISIARKSRIGSSIGEKPVQLYALTAVLAGMF